MSSPTIAHTTGTIWDSHCVIPESESELHLLACDAVLDDSMTSMKYLSEFLEQLLKTEKCNQIFHQNYEDKKYEIWKEETALSDPGEPKSSLCAV